ncbi:hypothetical protein BP6252_03689 [Coleophoma cylindrospora]|uniref:Sphingoid long-chain base transporter RSB1 n=1 Tax=Coleophoma cylindrospora TaxID=1849047 RepID=A0A3D8S8B2_9HELO|nr:hypothetical protein BP6252_03689 [Coleophoma cylindrospora]
MSDLQYFLNGSLIDPISCPQTDCCTLAICPLEYALIHHLPNVAGTVIFLTLFTILLIAQIGLCIKYRTVYFSTAMVCGLILEVLGYVGRVMERNNPFDFSAFLLNYSSYHRPRFHVCSHLYLSRTNCCHLWWWNISIGAFNIYVYLRRFRLPQSAGGAVTSIAPADNQSLAQAGIHIMIAGLSLQVVSLVIFIVLCADFGFKKLKNRQDWEAAHQDIWSSKRWKLFLGALVIAIITILVRSAFRVAELSQGFSSKSANNEVTQLVLEGTMVFIASIALTALHPGYTFKCQCRELSFGWRKNRDVETTSRAKVIKSESDVQKPAAEK